MTAPRVGLITIGQAPRDDIVPDMVAQIGHDVEVLEAGAIDGLSREAALALAPVGDEPWVVSRMRDGFEVRLAKRHLIPRMQQRVDELSEQGAALIVPLCASDWSALRCELPFINPGLALESVARAMLRPGGTLGIVMPTEAQAEIEVERARGGPVPVVTTFAQPYADSEEERLRQSRAAGRLLREAGADLIYMGCMGHTRAMRAAVRETSGAPVISANGVIASLIAQATA